VFICKVLFILTIKASKLRRVSRVMQRFAMKYFVSATVVIFITSLGIFAQNPRSTPKPQPTPILVIEKEREAAPVVRGNNLFCAGFIQTAKFNTSLSIVGGDEEGETRHYEQNDYVYISGGAAKGVEVGDEFSIIRPMGKERSPFSKKNNLGIYTREVGLAEVIDVRSDVAVAKISMACDDVLLGDLLYPMDGRVSPLKKPEDVMDRFAAPNGKSVGRIVLGRDGQESLTKDQIVYIDLGAEDSIKTGDYFTIYRPLGKKEIFPFTDNETVDPKDLGRESFHYRGGKFSNETPRRDGESGTGSIVTTDKAKKGRPHDLRKVVGEVVILNVKERTATAVITRVIQEVHPGDFVELQ
jgi:hypothetical protein